MNEAPEKLLPEDMELFKTPWSSVVGGGLQIADKGGVRFQIMIVGTEGGITKEEDAEICQRIIDAWNRADLAERGGTQPQAVRDVDLGTITLGDLDFLKKLSLALNYLETSPDKDPERISATEIIFEAACRYRNLIAASINPNPANGLSDVGDTGVVEIPGLETALMNAVRPAYDIHVRCPSCREEVVTNNGEWLLWCGAKEHAEAILEAARRYRRMEKLMAAGWKMMPSEATKEMRQAAWDRTSVPADEEEYAEIYKAMHSAAPGVKG